jgi:hypothetical protein
MPSTVVYQTVWKQSARLFCIDQPALQVSANGIVQLLELQIRGGAVFVVMGLNQKVAMFIRIQQRVKKSMSTVGKQLVDTGELREDLKVSRLQFALVLRGELVTSIWQAYDDIGEAVQVAVDGSLTDPELIR